MPDPIRQIALSRWAERVLAAHPELQAELDARAAFNADEMSSALAGARDDDERALKRRLRRLRQRVFLRTMARDLKGDLQGDPRDDAAAKLAEVCQAMTRLAELSIGAALEWIREPEFIVVAMGKLGGGELNVSSDIDLVFVHPDHGQPQRLERAGRKLIAPLNDVTEDS